MNEEQKDRSAQIQKFCEDRGITEVVHFTRVSNLDSILQHGLLGRNDLQSREIPFQSNDKLRLDGCQNAICLSITFPNYKMFYACSSAKREDWTVLILKPSVLWELDCAFCVENAAAKVVTAVPISTRKKVENLEAMFADKINLNRAFCKLPQNYTSHPQAEVLCLDSIAPSYISQVHFYTKQAWNEWFTRYPQHYVAQKFWTGGTYYARRIDWQYYLKQTEDY